MRPPRLLLVAFAVALLLSVFFGVQSFRHAASITPEPDAPVAGWMTPRYVAMSWDVPRDVVAEALGVDLGEGAGRESLAGLAEERGVPVETLVADLEAAIAAHRDGAE